MTDAVPCLSLERLLELIPIAQPDEDPDWDEPARPLTNRELHDLLQSYAEARVRAAFAMDAEFRP